MITRSKSKKEKLEKEKLENKLDITNLPKEALFNLLLQVEPNEIKIVCLSKNPRVREICNSALFKKAYKEKYPKKLMGDRKFANFGRGFIEIIDEKKLNIIRISYNEDTEELDYIEFIPSRQIYPSTVMPKNVIFSDLQLTRYNPMFMIIDEGEDGKFRMTIGRYNIYGLSAVKDAERFTENYNQEVKEFLQSIEREKWWNPNIQFRENYATDKAMKEFYNEVMDILRDMRDMNLLEKYPNFQI